MIIRLFFDVDDISFSTEVPSDGERVKRALTN